MNTFDFDEVAVRFNNPREILDRYTYTDGSYIFERIEQAEENDYRELNDILNEIVLWKIGRTINVENRILRELESIKNIESPLIALEQHVQQIREILNGLLRCRGVRLAMASSFLHFFNKDVFPIFDQRAYRVIYKQEYKTSLQIEVNLDLYLDYLRKCCEYYEEHNLSRYFEFSEIDKYLYQLDKEAGNKVKY